MRALLFDLDGTLLDSGPDLADAVNAARGELGLVPLPTAEVLPHIGWGVTHLLTHTLPGTAIASDGDLEGAKQAFHAWYGAHVYHRSRPYEGADAALEAWSGRAALVTNKPWRYVEEILASTGWAAHFAAVVCGDEVRKPAPEPLWRALTELEAEAEAVLFVGDTEVDQQAALAAGVPFAAVPWGRVDAERTVSLLDLARAA